MECKCGGTTKERTVTEDGVIVLRYDRCQGCGCNNAREQAEKQRAREQAIREAVFPQKEMEF